MKDTFIINNGTPTAGAGIQIAPNGSASVRVLLSRVHLDRNTHGIVADGSNTTGSIVVQVRDSVVADSAGNGIWAKKAGVVVDRSSMTSNRSTSGWPECSIRATSSTKGS